MTERKYSATAVASTLTLGISSGTTTIPVASVTGWPTTYPYTVILDEDQATEEVIEISSASGLNLTASRGVDGTSAQAHALGASARHGFSARDFREAQQHIAASTDVHGVSGGGSVVGTNTAQTLTNKTLTSPTISGGTQSSPTITTPTIASFTNATHNHSNAAGGGNIPQASVTSLVSDLSAKAASSQVTTDIATHAGLTATHGATGAVVGTTNTQTLDNKTLGISTVFPAPQGKDLIMNGAMHVWQRGTSITCPAGTRTFTADRWAVTATGAAMTAAPTQWYTDYERTLMGLTSSGAVTAVDITQRIPHEELYGTTGSQAYTLSFYVYQTSGSAMTPQVLVNTANALDDFSAVTNRVAATNTQSVADSGFGTFCYYTFTPNALTNYSNGIEIVLRFGAVPNTKVLKVGQVICFPGSSATTHPYPTASYGETQANCDSFYQRYSGVAQPFSNGSCTNNSIQYLCFPLRAPMRATPASSYSGLQGTDGTTTRAVNALVANTTTRTAASFQVGLAAGTALVNYRPGFVSGTASGSYIDFDAEL